MRAAGEATLGSTNSANPVKARMSNL
jgi:hypothetical protein